MRNIIKASIAISLLSFGITSTAAEAVVATGGKLQFRGEIVNAACAVSTESANQTIQLGQHRTAKFKAVGDKSASVPFTIKLQDCDVAVSQTASVAFDGNVDSVDNSVLTILSSDVGEAASGIGIEISDSKGKVLTPNGLFPTGQNLHNGNNTMHFTARYKATSATVTPGKADAVATFTMKYD